jgi:hypothetical protein
MKLVWANNRLEACREGNTSIHVGLFGVFLMMFMATLDVDLGVLLVVSTTDNDVPQVTGVL